MANQASLTVSDSWGWQDYVNGSKSGYSPSPSPSTTETGTDVGTLVSGGYDSGALPDGGTILYDYSISANVQHIDMSAIAPGYGDNDPSLAGKGEIGQAYEFVSADFVDYITNTSAGTLTLKMTYTLHGSTPIGDLQYTGLGSQLDGGPSYFGNGSGSYAETFTIPAHTTIPYQLNYNFGGNSGWQWGVVDNGGSYEPAAAPTGYEFEYDATSTGHTYIDELDSDGNVVPGNPDLVFASGIDWSTPACLAGGTRVLTARGEVAVEAVRPGELVAAVVGQSLRPVRRIAHHRVEPGRHGRAADVMPVRVRAGALGPGRPARDLVLSPDHAVFVAAAGALMPARYLLNGATVVQEPCAAVTYWHLEVAPHDVLLAEGLACETWLDTQGALADVRQPRRETAR